MLDTDNPSSHASTPVLENPLGNVRVDAAATENINDYATAFSHSMFGPSGRPQPQAPAEPTMPTASAPMLEEHEIFSPRDTHAGVSSFSPARSEIDFGAVLQNFIDHTNRKFAQKDIDIARTFDDHNHSLRDLRAHVEEHDVEFRGSLQLNMDHVREISKRLTAIETSLAHVAVLRHGSSSSAF